MLEDELKKTFEELNIHPLPRTFGAMDVVHRGVRLKRRRRGYAVAATGTGTTALVAVVVAFALNQPPDPSRTVPAGPPVPTVTNQPTTPKSGEQPLLTPPRPTTTPPPPASTPPTSTTTTSSPVPGREDPQGIPTATRTERPNPTTAVRPNPPMTTAQATAAPTTTAEPPATTAPRG
ncbi:hypothetical protein [Saccharothrix syringae]|uniref:hypothetical protein n=1 Tax=Saccharothrix syringae TaxID=103733 RepID=UPI000525F7F5|nr:hypothetical protein [Saccharothrix syringae]